MHFNSETGFENGIVKSEIIGYCQKMTLKIKLTKKFSTAKILGIVFLGISLSAPKANAVSRDVWDVAKFGAYGAAIGTGAGLVSFPFTGEAKTIFMGTSIGLYLGIIVGVFHVMNRDDPENPFSDKASFGSTHLERHAEWKHDDYISTYRMTTYNMMRKKQSLPLELKFNLIRF